MGRSLAMMFIELLYGRWGEVVVRWIRDDLIQLYDEGPTLECLSMEMWWSNVMNVIGYNLGRDWPSSRAPSKPSQESGKDITI